MDSIKDTQTNNLGSGHSVVSQEPLCSEVLQDGLSRHVTCKNVQDSTGSEHGSDAFVRSDLKETSEHTAESTDSVAYSEATAVAAAPNGIEQHQTLVNSELEEAVTRPSDSKIMNGNVLHTENDSFNSNVSPSECQIDSESTAVHLDEASTASHPDEASTSPASSSSSSSRKQSRSSETNSKANKKRKVETSEPHCPSPNADVNEESDNSPETPNGPKKSRKHPVSSVTTGKKSKQPSATYRSQISPDQKGIKLFIKKSSDDSPHGKSEAKRKSPKGKTKAQQKRTKQVRWAEEAGSEGDQDQVEREQSEWGLRLPETALHKIFLMLSYDEGCLPFLSRASRVCQLWYQAAIMPSLWHNIDLTGPWFKDKFKNATKLKWLCENRLSRVQELNLAAWKVPGIQAVLDTLAECCPDLRGLNLTGWQRLSAEHLAFLVDHCASLSRLDLSSICPQNVNNKGACSLMSLTNLAQVLGERLTHLVLANNRLSGLPQIVTALATHCPNLQVLDVSNMTTGSVTTVPLHIEKLQKGCQKLRVLRITNSQVALSQIPLKEQADAPGFPLLEELSVAGIGVGGLCSTPIVDDNSIERILKSSHKLRLLDVRGCTRISDSSLVRVPAWDLEHLFLSGCYVTRLRGNGLELIAQKWSHSLVEMDLGWSSDNEALDMAVCALAECDAESRLRTLNLCGSSVSLEPVKKVLTKCRHLVSLNLASCRALPRGIKRLYEGGEVDTLRTSLEKRTETPPKDEEEPEVLS